MLRSVAISTQKTGIHNSQYFLQCYFFTVWTFLQHTWVGYIEFDLRVTQTWTLNLNYFELFYSTIEVVLIYLGDNVASFKCLFFVTPFSGQINSPSSNNLCTVHIFMLSWLNLLIVKSLKSKRRGLYLKGLPNLFSVEVFSWTLAISFQ